MITYNEKERIFKLDTKNSSYVIGLADTPGYVGHVYYGKRLESDNLSYLLRTHEPPYIPSANQRDKSSFMDSYPMEYPGGGVGDFRESALEIQSENGHYGCELLYKSHSIISGKPALGGLPAVFAHEDECQTLNITCFDPVTDLEVVLSYSAFSALDVIARNVTVRNCGRQTLYLDKVYSMCLDMDNRDFEMMTLHGSWARERHISRRTIDYGIQSVSSIRGESSHQDHPFLALVTPGTNAGQGEVYGFHFVYSGNFIAQSQLSQFGSVRTVMGIHPSGFRWKLEPETEFTAPEVILIYSGQGLDGMTHTFHDLYRSHLIRSPWKDRKRPVLINNWEATYFDFDSEKLLAIAEEAAESGIEMLVMDDGWFGKRNSDNCSLGDWYVNMQKLTAGLPDLVEKVKDKGLKFGIWFEPEMISPDSDLYRAHPDWALQIPGRTPTLCREQLVLDLTRSEVREYVYEAVASILRSADISYVKWDMNRQLCDIGSFKLPADRQGEILHRYVLAVYELQERLLREFPELLLENCSGGGARFDPGMLYYSPQIWCSDDTDAIERLRIQEGTALLYPLSAIGAHVSDCPNHTVGRTTPFTTRAHVALAGTFGYELDITKIPPKDRAQIPEQIQTYHQYNDLIRTGTYYHLHSWTADSPWESWQTTAKDCSEALITYIQVLARPNHHSHKLRLKGLDPQAFYQIDGDKTLYRGDTLMHAGLLIPPMWGDYQSQLIHLQKTSLSKMSQLQNLKD